MLRTELAFRTAAAHGCQPAAAGRFWAVFGLLTPTEQSSYTGRPGVLALLRRPLHESEAAASTRFQVGDLVTDLVTEPQLVPALESRSDLAHVVR